MSLYSRGLFAESKGFDVLDRKEAYNEHIPVLLVTDAKDVFDKTSSDTPTYGSQKSLAFTVGWIREVLRKARTSIAWTATENMVIDCGAKEMSTDHLRAVLEKGHWSVTYNPSFVKQTAKSKRAPRQLVCSSSLPGRVLSGSDPVVSHLMKLAEQPGWHLKGSTGIHVCRAAKSLRLGAPRFSPTEYPLRSTYGRFDTEEQGEWRILEDRGEHRTPRLIGDTAAVLVTFFHSLESPPLNQQKDRSTVKDYLIQG